MIKLIIISVIVATLGFVVGYFCGKDVSLGGSVGTKVVRDKEDGSLKAMTIFFDENYMKEDMEANNRGEHKQN